MAGMAAAHRPHHRPSGGVRPRAPRHRLTARRSLAPRPADLSSQLVEDVGHLRRLEQESGMAGRQGKYVVQVAGCQGVGFGDQPVLHGHRKRPVVGETNVRCGRWCPRYRRVHGSRPLSPQGTAITVSPLRYWPRSSHLMFACACTPWTASTGRSPPGPGWVLQHALVVGRGAGEDRHDPIRVLCLQAWMYTSMTSRTCCLGSPSGVSCGVVCNAVKSRPGPGPGRVASGPGAAANWSFCGSAWGLGPRRRLGACLPVPPSWAC